MANVRLQVLDPINPFACGSCASCCSQPWGIVIEADKAKALDQHDFSAYPHLAGKQIYRHKKGAPPNTFILSKGEGFRCVFLDTDNLCIIHKELGPAAKPYPCLKFPYVVSSGPMEDRVSIDFGCPSAQAELGQPLAEQTDDIHQVLPPSKQAAPVDARIGLDPSCALSLAETDALMDRLAGEFDPAATGNLWTRFARVLVTLVATKRLKQDGAPGDATLVDLLRAAAPLPHQPAVPVVRPFTRALDAPTPARLLFAATLFRDTVPLDAMMHMSLWRRMTMLPKLMSLARLSGAYPSRLLGRNIQMAEVMAHPLQTELPAEGEALLLRYFRTRLWQRYLAGTRLTVAAGVHQRIQDFNAILFFCRAEAQHRQLPAVNNALIKDALRNVEFHLANQQRMFDQNLVGWFQNQLQSVVMAAQSLRLMSLERVEADAPAAAG